MLQELPVAQQCHAITATGLIPLSEPEQGNHFLRWKAALSKGVRVREDRLCGLATCTTFELSPSLPQQTHAPIPQERCLHAALLQRWFRGNSDGFPPLAPSCSLFPPFRHSP